MSVQAGDPQVVQFSCRQGSGAAVWLGAEPALGGTTRHAEIDHAKPLRWVSRGTLTDGSRFSCRLEAIVESTDDDALLVLRVGDGLLLAELVAGEEVVAPGTAVTLVDVELTLWPYDL